MNTPNFPNAICTNKEQSDKMLRLGINPNTADMFLDSELDDNDKDYFQPKVIEQWMDIEAVPDMYVPAWSLSRLVDMMPVIEGLSGAFFTTWSSKDEHGYKVSYKTCYDSAMLGTHYHDTPISAYIDMIEWTIREGFFSKDYLKTK